MDELLPVLSVLRVGALLYLWGALHLGKLWKQRLCPLGGDLPRAKPRSCTEEAGAFGPQKILKK